jgi:putative DNA primase/helicase
MTYDYAAAAELAQDIFSALAKVPRVEYNLCRIEKAKALKMRVTVLDSEVEKLRPKAIAPETGKSGTAVTFPDIEDWPDDVTGEKLLDAISNTIKRFLVLPVGGAVVFALWVMHTFLLDVADASPVLGVTSPEKRCGKTLVLEIAEMLVKRPLLAASITPAAVYRTVEACTPTLLIDEADTFLRDNEELRGVLNSGHRRKSASVIRLVPVGDGYEPRKFSTWCAKAIATIGKLPGTLEDRSIQIKMRRKTVKEKVEPWRPKVLAKICEPLRRQASKWAADNMESVAQANPSMPDALDDRAADCWRPLFAIAAIAGGDWLEKATAAALALSTGEAANDSSTQVQMLIDIKEMFERRDVDRLTSQDIVSELAEMEDRLWQEWKNGKAITKTGLARVLKRFDIAPKSIRTEPGTPKGYMREQFDDAFSRYTPSQSATPPQINGGAGLADSSNRNTPMDVALPKNDNANVLNGVADVAVQTGVLGENGDVRADGSAQMNPLVQLFLATYRNDVGSANTKRKADEL